MDKHVKTPRSVCQGVRATMRRRQSFSKYKASEASSGSFWKHDESAQGNFFKQTGPH